jgi:hypothetical protein
MDKARTSQGFEDRLSQATGASRGRWSGAEVTIFSGPNARERAIQYADWRYRHCRAALARPSEGCYLIPNEPAALSTNSPRNWVSPKRLPAAPLWD